MNSTLTQTVATRQGAAPPPPAPPPPNAAAAPDPTIMGRSRLAEIQNWPQFAVACACDPETMAVRAEVCVRQLERFILARFGVRLELWLRDVKCRLGAAALLEGYNTAAAAEKAQYASSSGLCHAFKKVFGMCPQRYVLQQRIEKRRPKTIMSL
jgi:AraC-like DNA-binding protein